jgi:hypothetical protein
MLRFLSAAALCAMALSAAGCTLSLGNGQQVTITAADVKAAVAASCSLEPTSEQITAAIDAANKTAADIESVAKSLCAGAQPFIAPTPATPAQPASGG